MIAVISRVMAFIRSGVACGLLIAIFAVGAAAQPSPEKPHQASCCAHLKGVAHCSNKQAPAKPEQDQCCGFCVLGMALISDQVASFQPPPLGDELFPNFVMKERSRSDRPPVPPPRA
jgi:hypothetical protein